MNAKEIVRRTLDFEYPERVAQSFWDETDLNGIGPQVESSATEWKQIGESEWERYDEWGNTWGRIDPTSKGEVTKGVLDDLNDLESYEFPDYSNSADYDNVREFVKNTPDKWIIGGLPGFTFNIARKLRKLEHYLMDILLEPAAIHRMHDRIDIVLKDLINNYGTTGVDAIMFPEDWGTQEQTLLSPQLWREEFFPRTKMLCELAHSYGMKVMMHSCGKIEAIVPGLIEAGIDCLQFDQPKLHGIDKLASYQENARITFWCPVDIQKTLQTKNETIIRAEAKEMIDKLWKGRGGFIAGWYGDNPSIGLEPVWQEIAADEYRKQGIISNYCSDGYERCDTVAPTYAAR
jgi:hypothetical protein